MGINNTSIARRSSLEKATVMIGFGQTGVSVARYFQRKQEPLVIYDTRLTPPGLESISEEEMATWRLHLGCPNLDDFSRASRIIVSPGFPLTHPALVAAREAGVEVIGDVALFLKDNRSPVIAITGSNGKSTVTSLVAQMFRIAGRSVEAAGNIGLPVFDMPETVDPQNRWLVLELSSYHLETISDFRPVASVVLNVSPDHLDRYDSFEKYAEVKAHIYEHSECRIVNRDDPWLADFYAKNSDVGFTLNNPDDEQTFGLRSANGKIWLSKGQKMLMEASAVRLKGRHNLANALAALALGEAAGLSLDAMREALATYPGLPHRCEWVGCYQGIDYFNDSKGTNVGATIAAIEGLSRSVVLIAGGLGKGQDFSALKASVDRFVRAVVLIGKDAALIAEALGNNVTIKFADSMRDAVRQASCCAREGDAILLSPACASQDMFGNYEERGRAFVAAVEEMTQ